MTSPPVCRPFPLRLLAAGCLLVVAAISTLSADTSVDFRPYFADLPAAGVAAIVCVIGTLALYVLQQRFGFCVVGTRFGRRGLLKAAAVSVPFMGIVTLADLSIGFPSDIHVALPVALIFYPAMGFIALLALHIVPFAVVLWALGRLPGSWPLQRRIWTAIILSASVEAAFQTSGSATSGGLTMLSVFVAVQLFAFGLVELYLFRRFDFVTMYVFRLAYYGYWHILWGNVLQSSS